MTDKFGSGLNLGCFRKEHPRQHQQHTLWGSGMDINPWSYKQVQLNARQSLAWRMKMPQRSTVRIRNPPKLYPDSVVNGENLTSLLKKANCLQSAPTSASSNPTVLDPCGVPSANKYAYAPHLHFRSPERLLEERRLLAGRSNSIASYPEFTRALTCVLFAGTEDYDSYRRSVTHSAHSSYAFEQRERNVHGGNRYHRCCAPEIRHAEQIWNQDCLFRKLNH